MALAWSALNSSKHRVAADLLAVLVDVDVFAEQLHAQAADERLVPGLVRHFLARRVEPGDLGGLGALDRLAVEEAAAMEDRLLRGRRSITRRTNSSSDFLLRASRFQSSQVISLSWQ